MAHSIIRRRRIRSLRRHLVAVPPGSSVSLAVRITDARRPTLTAIGLGASPEPGDTILPKPLGPVSRFNAEGTELVRRDLPMETAYYQRLWKWEEWHGRSTIEREKIVDVPYERYPRDPIAPPAVELRCAALVSGEHLVVVDGGTYSTDNEESLLHQINLMLELFGECEVLRPDLAPFVSTPLRRLNWEVLPPGRLPWDRVRRALGSIVERAKPGNRPVVQARFDALLGFNPKFLAVGQGGFEGYLVFGFERLGLYVLESAFYGNATYVLGTDWERLSQMSKAELLDASLHEDRIIHRAESWEARIHKLLSAARDEAA